MLSPAGYSGSFALMACHNETDLFGKIVMINPPALNALNKIPDKKSKLYKSFWKYLFLELWFII